MKLNRLIEVRDRHPLAIALVIVLGYLLYFVTPVALAPDSSAFGNGEVHADVASFTAQLSSELALAASVVAAIALLGWFRAARLTTPIRRRGVLWTVPPLLFTAALGAVALVVGVASPAEALPGAAVLLTLLATVALVGVFEELLFRGILFHGVEARTNALTALIASSSLFGLMHYVNWVGGQPFDATTAQALHAAGGGFLYGALMLATGSIWPSVVLHATWDATVSLVSTVTDGRLDATVVETDALDAVKNAPPEDGGFVELLASALIGGFEPIYGLAVFCAYRAGLKRRARSAGQAA